MPITTPNDSQFFSDAAVVYVPVPTAHLGVVYSALVAAMTDGAAALTAPTPAARPGSELPEKFDGEQAGVFVGGEGLWTPEMIRLLDERLLYPGARAVITMLAERAPKDLTLVEVEDATGISINQLRAELGALTKLIKRIFEIGEKKRPFATHWGAGGVANYYMPAQIARWWLDLTAEDSAA